MAVSLSRLDMVLSNDAGRVSSGVRVGVAFSFLLELKRNDIGLLT